MFRIQVVERTLSDGSKCYDVVMGKRVLPAITRDDAEWLAEKIGDAIVEHTNEDAEVDLG